MRLVFLSDSHNLHDYIEIPDGDYIFHSGDITEYGTKSEIDEFINWYDKLNFKEKFFISGNHDIWMETYKLEDLPNNIHLINDELYDLNTDEGNLRIYGFPWTTKFGNWSFMLDNKDMKKKVEEIPDCDILLSHGPPFNMMDKVERFRGFTINTGSMDLATRIARISTKIISFGHIHDEYGLSVLNGRYYLNSSILNKDNKPICKPIVLDIEIKENKLIIK
jgi:Icc-related predicted phosphoesterase